ncbi:GntR family transcriptional regulator [Streptomyces sp. RK75]|uniref:GntR family transcriptional regulator n=1 Tax=Streptomyces sp. RK75 TaxID=2824895 RepID=UPI001B3739EE|nr:GntR family transcriptional regulator [Streptomyces sp. RK75]MBQ0868290.1 GntR family transcriptional regulator [Streptomyces sp. RK75]
MGEIQRPGALYRQVAAAIRDAILSGEFEPGAPLPSEAHLIDRYNVSRPTVRNAIAALRAEGLIEVIHGKGSFVRSAPASAFTMDRAVSRDAEGAYAIGTEGWQLHEEPSIYRTSVAFGEEQEPEEAAFGVDRLWVDPDTGVRIAHRTLIPFRTAEGTELEQAPDTAPEKIYALLTEAGHKLRWTETARARMPLPDERTTLQLPDATPVLHTTRTTYGRKNAALLREEFRVNGDRAQAAYRITAESTRQLRAVRD